MGEHVVSSMVIVAAPDIAMEDRHAVSTPVGIQASAAA